MTPFSNTVMICTIVVILFNVLQNANCFVSNKILRNNVKGLYSLSPDAINSLNEIKGKYDRLVNVESEEATSEIQKIKETVEKYSTYIEVNKLMKKLRSMHINEASDRRKEKLLKSFIELYQGKLQLEEILKEKIGLPFKKEEIVADEVKQLRNLEDEILSLEAKLKKAELILPEGKSTREERFAY